MMGTQGEATGLSKFLQSGNQAPEAADRNARALAEPGAFTAAINAINWYRAFPLSDIRGVGEKITVPTMFVWSDGDTYVLGKGARDCGRYVSGEYRFETRYGVSHWTLDEQPDEVADLLLERFAAHPI